MGLEFRESEDSDPGVSWERRLETVEIDVEDVEAGNEAVGVE